MGLFVRSHLRISPLQFLDFLTLLFGQTVGTFLVFVLDEFRTCGRGLVDRTVAFFRFCRVAVFAGVLRHGLTLDRLARIERCGQRFFRAEGVLRRDRRAGIRIGRGETLRFGDVCDAQRRCQRFERIEILGFLEANFGRRRRRLHGTRQNAVARTRTRRR